MSLTINLNEEPKTCEECEIYKSCNKRDIQSSSCPKKVLKEKFKQIWEDEDEEDSDL